ncbi:class I SAM-dependent RNA methyltransferase [Paroceanicella profunda]|uniref:Class I SAM-dependent RNA methyltransferase n=1 Tax=Paroceanicella profunda TaxID=2579971 RepID=A0A5B8FZK6_9RHOB|nr:class I SAM-dependent RNA methyltransferase [Paroceanicella profunda]QDL92092.1 class I SAM-dependent RNA methyltransferase [Paroceanicella profunda]
MQELVIDSLGHLGDGVAAGPDGPVMVPFALPGERVRGEVVAGRMPDAAILSASPLRVAPPCPQFGVCGGCTVQHLEDGALAGWKAETVRRALAARGLEAEIAGVETSPPRSRRRAVLSARRTKTGVTLGFHARASDRLVAVEDCVVIDPALLLARPAVAALARLGGSRKGEVKAHVTVSEAGLDIDLRNVKPLDGPMRVAAAGLAAEHDLARLAWEGEVVAERRPPLIAMGPAVVVPPPGAFLQATREGQAALVAAVCSILDGVGTVADLFSGCGTFSLPLAGAAEVHAVEGEAGLLAALDAGWRRATGLRRLTTERRDLFRRPLGAPELARFGGVVIDPPRAGAKAQCEELAASRVPAIAAVSCNPASFARDARTLVDGGYRLGAVTVVDQFRWTGHVELVAAFTRG